MADPKSTIVCAACGEGFLMQEVIDGLEDIPTFVDPITGIKTFFHSDCLELNDIQVIGFQLPREMMPAGGLALCFGRQETARRYFKRMRESIDKGRGLSVKFTADGVGSYFLIIRTRFDDARPSAPGELNLEFNGVSRECVQATTASLESAGYFLIVAGKLNGGFTLFEGPDYWIAGNSQVEVDGKELRGKSKPGK